MRQRCCDCMILDLMHCFGMKIGDKICAYWGVIISKSQQYKYNDCEKYLSEENARYAKGIKHGKNKYH